MNVETGKVIIDRQTKKNILCLSLSLQMLTIELAHQCHNQLGTVCFER